MLTPDGVLGHWRAHGRGDPDVRQLAHYLFMGGGALGASKHSDPYFPQFLFPAEGIVTNVMLAGER